MPIVRFFLVSTAYSEEAVAGLLTEASRFYAAALYPEAPEPPVERVRAFVVDVSPEHWATGGKLVSQGGQAAPFFKCISLPGRPAEQMTHLMEGFTRLIVDWLKVDVQHVRGQLDIVTPENWWIAGRSAADVRRSEVEKRQSAASAAAMDNR